jgi:pyruvate dehydrogenase E2 component (dihydrolipoamide acetyltransferase)
MPGLELTPWPEVDFARYGPVETRRLSRIRRIAAANLRRNWVMIPHVTHRDEADVTNVDQRRQRGNASVGADAPRLTLLAFVLKATALALEACPELNSSLVGDEVVVKRYYNLGVVVETPRGLVVPVIRDAKRKSVEDIGGELTRLAAVARAGKLTPDEMDGRTFTVSSVGHIGGTGFTPIINAPDVAILGVARAARRPLWTGCDFVPRLMLPLCLSYDHRVVDGGEAARFTRRLAEILDDDQRTWPDDCAQQCATDRLPGKG